MGVGILEIYCLTRVSIVASICTVVDVAEDSLPQAMIKLITML